MMTRKRWITATTAWDLYKINYKDLVRLYKLGALERKMADKSGSKGRTPYLYWHPVIKVHAKLDKAGRRNHLAKLAGTTIGRPKKAESKKAGLKIGTRQASKAEIKKAKEFQKVQKEVTDWVKKASYESYRKDDVDKVKKYWENRPIGMEYVKGVNHPKYYNPGKIEVIDVIEDWGLDFAAGNVVKYIARAGMKESDRKKDLQKALWYIQRMLNNC